MNTPQASRATASGGADFRLQARMIDFSYGRVATLKQVSMVVGGGELVAVVGPNGCGKTTLLKIFCGQVQPQSGQVVVTEPRGGEEDLARLSPAEIARRIALVPQNTTVGFAYSVRQIVLMGRWPTHGAGRGGLSTALGFETSQDHEQAEAALRAMQLLGLAERPITSLSGGERQRVIIARALAQETPALLLDEPTSALDLAHQLELMAHLHRLTRERNKAVLLVTHDLNLAMQYADRVVVMEAGQVRAEGPPCTTLTPAILEPVYGVRVQVGSPHILHFARRT